MVYRWVAGQWEIEEQNGHLNSKNEYRRKTERKIHHDIDTQCTPDKL
jgi:hypothetical protein